MSGALSNTRLDDLGTQHGMLAFFVTLSFSVTGQNEGKLKDTSIIT
jgi:hypothetical protein